MIRSYEVIDRSTINAPLGLVNIFNYSTIDSRNYRFFESSKRSIVYTDSSKIEGIKIQVIDLKEKFTITNELKEVAVKSSNFINSNDKIHNISISTKYKVELSFPLYIYVSGKHKIRNIEKFKVVDLRSSNLIDRASLLEKDIKTSYIIDKSNISSFSFWSENYVFLEEYESKYIGEDIEDSIFKIYKSESVNPGSGIVDGDSCILLISNGAHILPTYIPFVYNAGNTIHIAELKIEMNNLDINVKVKINKSQPLVLSVGKQI